MKISIQGQAGSYHDIARQQYFSEPTSLVAKDTFRGVFESVASGSSDKGIIALENTIYGSIHPVYDLFREHDVQIVGEIYLRIHHCLLSTGVRQLKDIEVVLSQDVALAQCQEFLQTHLPNAAWRDVHDTAAAAELVANNPTEPWAAVASASAGKLANLHILHKGIETNQQNYTRFVVIEPSGRSESGNKTSIVLQTSHQPGALYKALGVFATLNMNLTQLESRPIVGDAWNYQFHIDVVHDDKSFKPAKDQLEAQGCKVRVLGTYDKGAQLEEV